MAGCSISMMLCCSSMCGYVKAMNHWHSACFPLVERHLAVEVEVASNGALAVSSNLLRLESLRRASTSWIDPFEH